MRAELAGIGVEELRTPAEVDDAVRNTPGTLIESIAVPELRQQAADLAELLAAKFAERAQDTVPSTALADALQTTSAGVGYELAS